MSKLPYKEFAEILASFERYEHTRVLADALKYWLAALRQVPDDVHSFSLSAENSLGAYIFCLEAQCGPVIDAMATFKDGSKEKARFSLTGRCLVTWADMLKAVRA